MAIYEFLALRIRQGVDPRTRSRAWYAGELEKELAYEDGLTPEQEEELRRVVDALLALDGGLKPRRRKWKTDADDPAVELTGGDLELEVTPDLVGFEIDTGVSGRGALHELRRAWQLLEHLAHEEGFVVYDGRLDDWIDVETDAPLVLRSMREATPGWAKAGSLLLAPFRLRGTLNRRLAFLVVSAAAVYLTSWTLTGIRQLLSDGPHERPVFRSGLDVVVMAAALLLFWGASVLMARRYVAGVRRNIDARAWLREFPDPEGASRTPVGPGNLRSRIR